MIADRGRHARSAAMRVMAVGRETVQKRGNEYSVRRAKSLRFILPSKMGHSCVT
jgi:hypothetical protein